MKSTMTQQKVAGGVQEAPKIHSPDSLIRLGRNGTREYTTAELENFRR